MILIILPFTGILQLTLPKVRLALPIHFIILPLTLIISASLLKLILTLTVLEVALLLANILSSNILVIYLMDFFELLVVLLFASHPAPNFGVVSAGNGQGRVVGADVRALDGASGVASGSA